MELHCQKRHLTSPAGAPPGYLEIRQLQLRKLRGLLETILPANLFYARKLSESVKGSLDSALASLDHYWRTVPTTTRHEIVRDRLANPPYGTNLTFPIDNYVRCHQTSGTTTVPIRWLDTRESWDYIVDNWVRIFESAGVNRRDRFFFAFSFGPFLGFWSALDAVLRLGCFCFPGGSMTSIARLQAILDNGITVLCCTPTYAQHLGEVAAERNIDLTRSPLRLIIVAGESGGSVTATRNRIERLWPGAKVFDHHGMTEVGPVTYQCPKQPGVLHVLESAYLPEVIAPNSDTPVAPLNTGELLLTTLDRVGSPLLRYRTGDLVKPRALSVCDCGSSELALEGGILGRSDDMVVVRGINVYPSLIEEIVRGQGDIPEYRVQLDCRSAMTELLVEIEAPRDCSEPKKLVANLEHSLQAILNLRIPVRLLPPGSLPRFEMKALRWVKITE